MVQQVRRLWFNQQPVDLPHLWENRSRRYGRAHAQAHYQNTTHLYALELEAQRVWNYARDGYAHRLIQNKVDGKPVELPSATTSSKAGGRKETSGCVPDLPTPSLPRRSRPLEYSYSYSLTSQPNSQRSFYEDRVCELESTVSELKLLVTRLSTEAEEGKRGEAGKPRGRTWKKGENRRTGEGRGKSGEECREVIHALEGAGEGTQEKASGEGLMRNLQTLKEMVEFSE